MQNPAKRANSPTHPIKEATPRGFSFIEPMKALPVEKLPEGDWLYEVKLDGYRALALKDGKDVRLISRNNKPLNYLQVLDSLKLFWPSRRLSLSVPARNPGFIPPQTIPQNPNDLPVYNHDIIVSRFNPAEATLTPKSVKHLKIKWVFPTAGGMYTPHLLCSTISCTPATLAVPSMP
jgi:hypothetical protein